MDRFDAIPVILWSFRAGAVGETDSSHFARTLAADPSVRALLRRIHLTARAGSCADVSFHAAFRYPPSRASRGLAGREVLPSATCSRACDGLFRQRYMRVTRCLVRRRSWGSYPSQVYSRNRVVDAVQAPRLNCALATFLSDRAHVSFAPKASASRLIFVGMTGRPLEP
jgi:hypothetical protein